MTTSSTSTPSSDRIDPRDARIATLEAELAASQERFSQLKLELDWLKKQLFGKKSEKLRPVEHSPQQIPLGDFLREKEREGDEPTITIPSHERKTKGKKRRGPEFVTPEGLRFSPDTPIVDVIVPEDVTTRDIPEDRKEYLEPEVSYRLAQHKSAYYVERIVRPKVKVKDDPKLPGLYSPPVPATLFPGSMAALSFLVGLVVQKYRFHMPLYRIHQMLQSTGITVSRMSLTNYEHRLGELLAPLANAIHKLALSRSVLIMDETPRKVWSRVDGSMKQSYMWLLYTETEVFFAMGPSRSHSVVYELLGVTRSFVLLTDGYDAYSRYAQDPRVEGKVTQANCWSHTRRLFLVAESHEKTLSLEALRRFIGKLYENEHKIRELELTGDAKRAFRQEHSKPVIDAFRPWLMEIHAKFSMIPKSPLTKACAYALERWQALTVFLDNPAVPLDTNEGEREMRPHAVGRKNYLFNMSTEGSEHVSTFYTVIQTCRLNGVDPHEYLTDVLPVLDLH